MRRKESKPGASQADPVVSGWRYRALVLSVLAAALGYLLVAVLSGWSDVLAALAQVGALGVVIALFLSSINYLSRFLRWQLYLRTLGHVVPWARSLHIYLAGFALTTTPGKAGEAFRGVLLKRHGVSYPDSFAAFLSERLSDLIAILLLTLFGLTMYPAALPVTLLGAGLATALLLLLSRAEWLSLLQEKVAVPGRLAKWIGHGWEILQQASRCHRPNTLALATALSLTGWAVEAYAFYLILQWMGLAIEFQFAVFVFAFGMLAGALTLTPGGLGSTEGVMAGLLVWQGVSLPEAVAATIIIRMTTLWFAVALGVAMLLFSSPFRPSQFLTQTQRER